MHYKYILNSVTSNKKKDVFANMSPARRNSKPIERCFSNVFDPDPPEEMLATHYIEWEPLNLRGSGVFY